MTDLPLRWTTGELEVVATIDGPMPTGVTVSHTGRVFVCFPRWGDDVPATVAEIVDGQVRPYPDAEVNLFDDRAQSDRLISVQSVVVDPADRLWLLDTGSIEMGPTEHGGPKMVCVDLATDSVVQTIVLPRDVALEGTYLNDVRFDLRRGGSGVAYITDSSDGLGPNAILVVDLASGRAMRRLHEHPSTRGVPDLVPVVEGWPLVMRNEDGSDEKVGFGADGIAIGADGSRLFYCPFLSRRLYSVSTDALADPDVPDDDVAATVVDEGDKGGISDGLESDAAGTLYLTSPEHGAILRRLADGTLEPVVVDPRLTFPDTLSLATDGYLYVTANQLPRQDIFWRGEDRRTPPYVVYRTRVDAAPVLLR